MPSDHNIKLPDHHILGTLTGTIEVFEEYSFIDLRVHFNVEIIIIIPRLFAIIHSTILKFNIGDIDPIISNTHLLNQEKMHVDAREMISKRMAGLARHVVKGLGDPCNEGNRPDNRSAVPSI